MKKLDPVDIFNIAKIASITNIYDKQVNELINEIDKIRNKELGDNVEKYFIKENINKSLIQHNQKFKPLLNETNCYITKIKLNNPKDIKAKQATILLDNNYSIKLFNSKDRLLFTEYIVYTYVIPFLYYSNMTFNILVPQITGTCPVERMATDNQYSKYITNQNLTDKMMYMVTPFIQHSLYDISFNDTDCYYYIFQILYTLASFGKIGLIQNDLHTSNIRVKNVKKPYPVKYVIDENISFNVNLTNIPLIMDFDYAGLANPISDLLKSYRLPNKNLAGEGICKDLSVCNDKDDGRRDTLVFLFRYAMSYYTPVNYIESNPHYSQTGFDFLAKLTNFKGENNETNFRKILVNTQRSKHFSQWKRNYNDILDLIIFITKGKNKIFFQNIKNKRYIPANRRWEEDFRKRNNNANPSPEEWMYDLLYRNKIPECPLPIPYTDNIIMAPIDILKSSYFRKFVEKTDKISNLYKPLSEVSIDVDDDFIEREYKRFMKEFFGA